MPDFSLDGRGLHETAVFAASLMLSLTVGCRDTSEVDPEPGSSSDDTSRADQELRSAGTDYVTFWSGDLRIMPIRGSASDEETSVEITDIDTGDRLDLESDGRVDSVSHSANPMTLSGPQDFFEGTGGLGGSAKEIRVRIESDAPVTVWTGSTLDQSGNSWGSLVPAAVAPDDSFGREIGTAFTGFSSSELVMTARRASTSTEVTVENLASETSTILTFDDAIADCPTPESTTPAIPTSATPCYLHDGDEVQVVYDNGYSPEAALRLTSNHPMSVLAGNKMLSESPEQPAGPTHDRADWSYTPPSWAQGDDGAELGTEFYVLVREQLTVFPTEDDTEVRVTDLSDEDDSRTVTLDHGTPDGEAFSLYTPFTAAQGGGDIVPRSSDPAVDIETNLGNAFDNDIVKVTSDKPILVYEGPTQSNVYEFADVAYSVPLGAQDRLVYAFAQNHGNSHDFQLFAFQRDTQVEITSLTVTGGFRSEEHHDFEIDFDVAPGTQPEVTSSPSGSQYTAVPTPGDIQHFGSGTWAAELLRIRSNKPITVINGDYDHTHFGAFIPFVSTSPELAPKAQVSASPTTVCPGETVDVDGRESFDQDDLGDAPPIRRYDWEFDDGTQRDDAAATVTHSYTEAGTYAAVLEVTDNESQTDTDTVDIEVLSSSNPDCGITTPVDIKPTSCPNPLNSKGRGVLPAAVPGSGLLEADEIDASTVELAVGGETVPAERSTIEDVATPFGGDIGDPPDCFEDCTTDGADGVDDLTLKFDRAEAREAIETALELEDDHGELCVPVTIRGETDEGQSFEGEDVIRLLATSKGKGRSP